MRRNLRVLQVSSYGLGHLGGLEASAEMLARFLPRQNCTVVWAFGTTGKPSAAGHKVRFRVVDLCERLIGVPIPVPLPSAWRTVFRLVRSCDVILVHDFMYFTSALTILCCLLLRRPFVLMVHVWRVNYTSALLNFCQSLAHAVFGWPAFRLASAVVTCSRENQRKIDTVRGTKTFFAANGIHASIAGAPREQPRNGAPSVFRRRVCFAGRCVEKKGLLRLKQAATSLPDVEFVIAGTGPINPATWNLPNVRSVGQLERAALVELFHQSDLLLMLSRGEGFPCVVQEAMAAGLPCALFDETWRGWGRDKERFHVVSDHGFVSDIRAILDAPLGLALRHGLVIYAQENWNWIRTAETFAGILRSAERMARLGHKREALQPAAT